MKKKIILVLCAIGLMLGTSGVSVNAFRLGNDFDMTVDNSMPQNINNGIINITAQEAYDMLTNTGDGIQIPIDVRRENEWKPQRIDTPIPEHPRWYLWDLIKNASILPKFLFQYDGCEIIVYCKGGYRSWKAANNISDAGFNGIIYNMLGGITAWNAAGLPTAPGGIYNITVQETYDLCISTLNGVQNPIDVRRIDEWEAGYIDTPWPECPIWFTLDLLKDKENRTRFKAEYIGNEVILYCKGGYRSLVGSYELYYDNFNGTQYNMLGGMNAWLAAGLPVRNNTPPADPSIAGPTRPAVGEDYDYKFSTTDAEGDVVYYRIDWGDGSPSVEWDGEYASGFVVILNHTFAIKGTYTITAQARDFYGNESGETKYIVEAPRNKAISFNLFEWLCDRFPVIRQLLGL